MENLSEFGLTELNESSLEEINGGISVDFSGSADVDISDVLVTLAGLLGGLDLGGILG